MGVGSHRHLLNKNQTTGRHQTTPQSIAGHVQQGQQNPWKESKCSRVTCLMKRHRPDAQRAPRAQQRQTQEPNWNGTLGEAFLKHALRENPRHRRRVGKGKLKPQCGIPSHLVGWSQSRTLLCIDLTAPGLSWCVGSSFLSRHGTRAPCIGSVVLATGPPGRSQGWLGFSKENKCR